MLNMLTDAAQVTIIIPTYNRRNELLRAIEYWVDYPVYLIILDGSAMSTLQSEDIPESRVTYLHIKKSFEERLNIGASMAQTPYAMFLSEDEFVLYSGLEEACRVLDSDSSVSAVLGRTLIFSTFKGHMVVAPCYTSAAKLNISSSSPIERFRERLSVPGNIIFYSLTRTSTLRLAGQFIAERTYSCPYIQEYQVESIICASGKVKVLPKVFWLRSLDVPPVSFKEWKRSTRVDDWLDDISNSSDIAHLSSTADGFFARCSGEGAKIKGQEFLVEVNKAARDMGALNKSIHQRIYVLGRDIYQSLPGWFRNFVRIARRLFRSSPSKGFKPIPQMIAELGDQVDERDLMRVKEIVESRLN